MALKIEQIAICVPNIDIAVRELEEFGIDTWNFDEVIAHGKVEGHEGANRAKLAFNYQLIPGIEFELISYRWGANWHGHPLKAGFRPHLSHLGLHVDSTGDLDADMRAERYTLAQGVDTLQHTNPAIAGKRSYHYNVWDSRDRLGFDLKTIQRIERK